MKTQLKEIEKIISIRDEKISRLDLIEAVIWFSGILALLIVIIV